MNPYLSVILTIAGVVLLFVLWIFYENYKNEKRVLEKSAAGMESRLPGNTNPAI